MSKKLIHSRKSLRSDIRWIRRQLAFAEKQMKGDNTDWADLQNLFMEMSGVAGNLESYCSDNLHEELDTYYK